ncbi:MAG: hypothetical protein FWH38_01580 [Treponema sp.]|nr:hypothetical protein [Treponema sp.]
MVKADSSLKEKSFIAGLCVLFALAAVFLSGCGKRPVYWYVEPEFERAWTRIVREGGPPGNFKEIRVWEGPKLPPVLLADMTGLAQEPGILIAAKPWQAREKVSVYSQLPYDLEYRGAVLLALDPWMVFQKYRDPPLTAERAYSGAGGDGALLIPGKDTESVEAWTARLIQAAPGEFPPGTEAWQDQERKLFEGGRFPNGAESYNWQDVFFRLMGGEAAWVYAPLSAIRRYPNPRKSILETAPFPERAGGGRYSLQAALLWALPLGPDDKKAGLAQALEWLKKPETQTLIADTLEWIPANPYGEPYDPVSLASHRNWLTATFVYEVNE